MTLRIVRDQWRRVVFMQTNREDVGTRYLEIRIPVPKSRETGQQASQAFRKYYKQVAKAREQLASYLAESRQHHFFVSGAEVSSCNRERRRVGQRSFSLLGIQPPSSPPTSTASPTPSTTPPSRPTTCTPSSPATAPHPRAPSQTETKRVGGFPPASATYLPTDDRRVTPTASRRLCRDAHSSISRKARFAQIAGRSSHPRGRRPARYGD